jgi:predicted MFS family arabinose efflux permease
MTSTPMPRALDEWRRYWPLVLTTSVGFSFHSIATYASGLFIEPLEQEFGWSRSEISIGLAIAAIATVPLSPVVGSYIVRWGSRRIALPGLLLTACTLAAFGTVSNSIAHWIGLWCIYAFIGLTVKSTVWTHAISSTFNAGRGLALAVMLSGTALAQALVPPIARWLIAEVGWREAWFWLGFGWCAPALILAFFFLKDRRHEAPVPAVKPDAAKAEGGMTIGQAFRNPALLKLALATFIMMTLGLAVIIHLVPILSERGLTRETAAWLAGLSGIAGIAGKLITGALMDRLDGAKIGAFTLASAALGFALLALPTGTSGTMIGATIVGYAVGTKLQVTAYLTTGSYAYLLMAGVPGSIVSGLLILSLRARVPNTPLSSA